MPSPQIDLSAGLVPKSQDIDLSAGLSPADQMSPQLQANRSKLQAGIDKQNQQDAQGSSQQHGTMANFGLGALKGAGNTVSGISSMVHSIPGIGPKMIPDSGLSGFQDLNKPSGTAQKVGYGTEQAAEYLVPFGGEEKMGLKAAEMLPQAGKIGSAAAKLFTSAAQTGLHNKLQGGSFTGGALAGGIGSGVTQGLKAAAPAIAETALGIRGTDRTFGKSPGTAVLNETSGLNPKTVASQAGSKIEDLTGQLDDTVKKSPAMMDMQPARQVIDDATGKAAAQNSGTALSGLKDTRLQLNNQMDPLSGKPTSALIPPQVPAYQGLQMKRGLNDLVGNWNSKGGNPAVGPTKQAYGVMADQLHNLVPESGELDSRISNLIPVRDRAQIIGQNAGQLQQGLGKFARPTGALASTIGGGYAGYKGDKDNPLAGAAYGAALGLGLPGVISSPAVQMGVARGLFSPATTSIVAPAMQGAAAQLFRPSQKNGKK